MASEIILYQTEDGQTKIQTRLENETVWLSQAQMATLFGKAKSTISEHIKNVFEEGELLQDSVVRNYRTTATDYLELAELQALNRKPMYMKDWLQRADDFIKMTGNNILTHAGTVSHKKALEKATENYNAYKDQIKNELSKVEKDFIKHLELTTKQLKKNKNGK